MALQNNGFGMAADEFCFGQHSGRGYSQERFLRELCEFVQRNKAIQRLFADGDTDTVGSDFVGCPFCASHPFVGSAAGYWIECSEKDCLKARKASKEESSPCKCVFASCVPEEIYRNYFYGSRHCTYFVKEDDIGPIFLTIKQEFLHSKDFVRYVCVRWAFLCNTMYLNCKSVHVCFSINIERNKRLFYVSRAMCSLVYCLIHWTERCCYSQKEWSLNVSHMKQSLKITAFQPISLVIRYYGKSLQNSCWHFRDKVVCIKAFFQESFFVWTLCSA